MSLLLGEREAALAAFKVAEEIIRGGSENSVWSNATLASAALARGDEDAALEALGKAKAL